MEPRPIPDPTARRLRSARDALAAALGRTKLLRRRVDERALGPAGVDAGLAVIEGSLRRVVDDVDALQAEPSARDNGWPPHRASAGEGEASL